MGKIIGIDVLRLAQYRNVCKCYELPNHPPIEYEIDPDNRIVSCKHCGNIVDPLVALITITKNWEEITNYYKEIRQEAARIFNLTRNYKPHRRAMKQIESEIGRNGRMLPCCPHCGEPFELEEIQRYVNREYIREYRRIEGIKKKDAGEEGGSGSC